MTRLQKNVEKSLDLYSQLETKLSKQISHEGDMDSKLLARSPNSLRKDLSSRYAVELAVNRCLFQIGSCHLLKREIEVISFI
jgi:hypothetical protein